MARKSDIYRSPPVDAALAGGIGEAEGRRSRRVAHVCDRYLEILRREGELPAFSKAEWELLREVSPRIPREPASSLRGLWQHVQDVAQFDRRAERLKVDAPGFVDRLKALSYVQEVALIEQVEELEAKGRKGDAPA